VSQALALNDQGQVLILSKKSTGELLWHYYAVTMGEMQGLDLTPPVKWSMVNQEIRNDAGAMVGTAQVVRTLYFTREGAFKHTVVRISQTPLPSGVSSTF
jgi:hypothetical protein